LLCREGEKKKGRALGEKKEKSGGCRDLTPGSKEHWGKRDAKKLAREIIDMSGRFGGNKALSKKNH